MGTPPRGSGSVGSMVVSLWHVYVGLLNHVRPMTPGQCAARAARILENNGIASMQGKHPRIEHILSVFTKDKKRVVRLLFGMSYQLRDFGGTLSLSFFPDAEGAVVPVAELSDNTPD